MQISWFEIIAQIINFFILLFILQKLFYKPVTKAMEDRQERITEAENLADEKMIEAEKLISNYDQKIADIDSEKREILDKAKENAEKNKEDLLVKYKQEAEQKRKSYIDEIEEEKKVFIENLRITLGKNAVKIASKILDTISSRELEDEVFKSFIGTLESIENDIPNKNALQNEKHLDIYSAQELTKDKKEDLNLILKKYFPNVENISYEINNELIIGYELSLETYTVHNSIKSYLDEIESSILDDLKNIKL